MALTHEQATRLKRIFKRTVPNVGGFGIGGDTEGLGYGINVYVDPEQELSIDELRALDHEANKALGRSLESSEVNVIRAPRIAHIS